MRFILCCFYVLMGAIVFAIPDMTRRQVLFAVPVPPYFRQTRAGRRAISMFRVVIAAVVLAGVCAFLFSPAEWLSAIATAAPAAILFVGAVSFYWQNRKLAPFAVQFTRSREAELTSAAEKLPRFAWLGAGPFAMLAAAAIWLNLNWDRIPARFPVHFDALGHANRWAERTTRGVYGSLLFGAELCAWILVMALAGWFGSRRSHSRSVMLGGMIATEYFLGFLFAIISLQALLGIPVWVIMLALIAVVVLLIVVIANKLSEPGDPVDPTPNECWKAGIFYYNPNDAALFVEKRVGLGYTFNLGNRLSWVLLLGLAVVIASAPFVAG
jgi:uncharacterized membrane protein